VAAWIRAQPDLTLAELQAKLHGEAGVTLSRGRVWYLLRKLGLRLKKSHSTPRNATQKPTSSGAKSSSPRSARSRRNT
jgi:transposase